MTRSFYKKILIVIGIVVVTIASQGFIIRGKENEIDMPPPIGFVNDFANIIDNDQELEYKLRSFEEETTNEVFVLTVTSLQGYSIDEFTIRLREQDGWKIGKKDKDNGILFVIAPNERKVRIDVGYGLESVLPPSKAGMIIEKTIKPYFKQDQYSEGINAGVDEIINTLRSGVAVNEEEVSEKNGQKIFEDIVVPLFCMSAFFPFFLLLVFPYVTTLLKKVPGYYLGGLLGLLIGGGVSWFFYKDMGWIALFSIPLSVLAGIGVDFISDSETEGTRKGSDRSSWRLSSGGGWGGGFSSWGGGFSGGGGGSSGGSGASSGW